MRAMFTSFQGMLKALETYSRFNIAEARDIRASAMNIFRSTATRSSFERSCKTSEAYSGQKEQVGEFRVREH